MSTWSNSHNMAAIPRIFTLLGIGAGGPGSFSSVTSSGGSFIGANGQTIVGDANGKWSVNGNGTNQNIDVIPSGTGQVNINNTTVASLAINSVSGAAYLNIVPSGSNTANLQRSGTTILTIGSTNIADFTTSVTVRVLNTTTSTTPITGAFRVGNDTAATTVGIGAGNVTIGNILGVPGAAVPVLTTATTITSGAAAQVGTLTNSPTAGNPTKWIPINDAGVTRYFPAW